MPCSLSSVVRTLASSTPCGTFGVFKFQMRCSGATCIRDYIHIEDLATAHLLALDGLEERSRLICNLGSGSGFSVREIIEVARKITGREIAVAESPRRAGDPAVLVASSEKIRQVLGWNPQHSEIEGIVRSAWQWHKANPQARG